MTNISARRNNQAGRYASGRLAKATNTPKIMPESFVSIARIR